MHGKKPSSNCMSSPVNLNYVALSNAVKFTGQWKLCYYALTLLQPSSIKSSEPGGVLAGGCQIDGDMQHM